MMLDCINRSTLPRPNSFSVNKSRSSLDDSSRPEGNGVDLHRARRRSKHTEQKVFTHQKCLARWRRGKLPLENQHAKLNVARSSSICPSPSVRGKGVQLVLGREITRFQLKCIRENVQKLKETNSTLLTNSLLTKFPLKKKSVIEFFMTIIHPFMIKLPVLATVPLRLLYINDLCYDSLTAQRY